MTPLVTIAVPTRNRVASLEKSLAMILGQDYTELEVIISDNASNDGTEQYCRALEQADARVRYVRHEQNIGLHGNHNFCLSAGRGEFLCVFHDHDAHDASIVSTYVAFMRRHEDVGVVCSNWDLVDESGHRLGVRENCARDVTPGLEFIERTMRSGRSAIGIPGAMIRRSALGATRFIEDAPIGFGDFPVWFEIAERWSIGHVNARLWQWTQSPSSQSARTITSMCRDYYDNLMRYCDAHVRRWPAHAELAARWKQSITRFLFWALAYEAGLYFRRREAGPSRSIVTDTPTLFEILGYHLTPAEFEQALVQMRTYRTGALQYAAFALITQLIRFKCTWPLAWGTRHHARARDVLRLS